MYKNFTAPGYFGQVQYFLDFKKQKVIITVVLRKDAINVNTFDYIFDYSKFLDKEEIKNITMEAINNAINDYDILEQKNKTHREIEKNLNSLGEWTIEI